MRTGNKFTAIIIGKRVYGKIFVKSSSAIYLCQDEVSGFSCDDKLGYRYSWILNLDEDHLKQSVSDFKILDENHFELNDLIENGNDLGKVIFSSEYVVIYENELGEASMPYTQQQLYKLGWRKK